uniref:Ig-like domain-containing protein n=1 Tax=Chromera velia CCMP2878 TaxID=1169474 RepID=A0A0G4I1M4_9ALVE|eukprot:Cvel_1665.t1-p1 / transcript=Cvel_1665.t1 / gene=Cvel_1665 / organism=Chromera_velia_CCMP2878 / gene_product=hypothetical protein / transcript_product=hypothetical protein / location=Cvel_scaffold60:4308-4874(+) / protein_length=189 / sequence_SO=supercontig / SO=protein_coding / is_pseudo=false
MRHPSSTSSLVFLVMSSYTLHTVQCSAYPSLLGVWSSGLNEVITFCSFDTRLKVYAGRTHWPDTPFNQDSAAITVVEYWDDETGDLSYKGVGSSSNGQYTCEWRVQEASLSELPSQSSASNTTSPSSEEVAVPGAAVAYGKYTFLNAPTSGHSYGESGEWNLSFLRDALPEECEQVLNPDDIPLQLVNM